MRWGENMNNKLKLLLFTVLTIIVSTTVIYADSYDTGWRGFGLYNLNESEVTISNESDTVTINGGYVSAVYEYTITCNSDKSITANFGYPDNRIYKFSVHDGSKFLNYKTRNTDYLRINYGADNLQTPEGRWYLVNMAFSPGQTRTIKVTIEAEMKKEENDTYVLNFFKDRNYSYAMPSEKTWLTLKLTDFKPYNIFELEGIKQEEISADGTYTISYSGDYGNGFSLRYQPIDKMILDKLSASAYKKPKAIAKAFNEKKYEEALTLCDEYLGSPADSNLSLEQVQLVKVECIRLLGNNQEYISAVEQLDITKLYPGRIRYKVLTDRIEAYDSIGNDEGMDMILKELIPEIQSGYPYLYHWMNKKGYKLKEPEKETVDIVTHTDKIANEDSGKGFDILGASLAFFTLVIESRWTYVIIGFLLGFLIGRLTKKRKKNKSVYLFRD